MSLTNINKYNSTVVIDKDLVVKDTTTFFVKSATDQIGIGTSTPGTNVKLDINGDLQVTGDLYINHKELSYFPSGSIIFWEDPNNIPAGWTKFNDFNDYFLKGSAFSGITGGSFSVLLNNVNFTKKHNHGFNYGSVSNHQHNTGMQNAGHSHYVYGHRDSYGRGVDAMTGGDTPDSNEEFRYAHDGGRTSGDFHTHNVPSYNSFYHTHYANVGQIGISSQAITNIPKYYGFILIKKT